MARAMNVLLRSNAVPLSAMTIREACISEAKGARNQKYGGE